MILSCIAVDDEILALKKVKRFASKIDFINLIGCFDNATDALSFLDKNNVDFIFLDIKMPDLTGFELLKKVKTKPYVILTTAFDHYAIESYESEVTDYILKPLQFDRFFKAVEKVYGLVKKDKKILSAREDNKEREHIFVKSSGSIIKVFIDDILYVQGMKDYLAIYLKNKRILTLASFKDFMNKIPANKFRRVHKSYLVAVHKIEEFGKDELKIYDIKIPVSKTYKNNILDLKNKTT